MLKNCIDYAFFYCFLVKFTKINGILSNFERKNRKKFKQLLMLRSFSGCLYKKKCTQKGKPWICKDSVLFWVHNDIIFSHALIKLEGRFSEFSLRLFAIEPLDANIWQQKWKTYLAWRVNRFGFFIFSFFLILIYFSYILIKKEQSVMDHTLEKEGQRCGKKEFYHPGTVKKGKKKNFLFVDSVSL